MEATVFFTTRRLTFRAFEPEDLETLAALTAAPEAMRFVGDGRPLTRERTAEWIEVSRRNVARHGYGTGALVERSGGELVGWGGMARPQGEPEELIYGFSPARWGQGLAGEFLEAFVRYARDELSLASLRATTWAENARSARVLERAGFAVTERLQDEDGASLVWTRPLGS